MNDSIWTTVQSTIKKATAASNSLNRQTDDLVIGLDFGTSNSCIAIWRRDKHRVKLVKNTRGEKITPSVIHFANNFESYWIGNPPPPVSSPTDPQPQQQQQYCTIQGIKSLLGITKLEQVPSYFTQPCRLEKNLEEEEEDGSENNHRIVIVVKDPLTQTEKIFTCEELIGLIISYLRLSLLQYLKKKPIDQTTTKTNKNIEYDLQRVVIGIPAHFPEKKREALRAAAIIGGFEEVNFMIESTAAAMAYGLLVAGEKYVLIFDMGGGTTDLTILYINNGRYDIQYTYGQSRLGGQDIDGLLVTHVIDVIILELSYWDISLQKEDFTNNLQILQTLYQQCKECKEQLSTEVEYSFHYQHLLTLLQHQHSSIYLLLQSQENKKKKNEKNNHNKAFSFLITRKQLEKWMLPILQKIEQTIIYTLQQYKKSILLRKSTQTDSLLDDEAAFLPEETKEDIPIVIDEVVLVGGSSQIPSIQSSLRKACGQMGLHSFSLRNENYPAAIEPTIAPSLLPSSSPSETALLKEPVNQAEAPINKEFCVSINPNYAVVEGLAIRGAILSGEDSSLLKDILMLDCLPMTIGILLWNKENTEKYFEPILYQGSKLPIEQKKRMILSNVKQKFVSLEIYEEIEEINPSVSVNSSSSNLEEVAGVDSSSPSMKYSYYLLITCDVLIEKNHWDHEKSVASNPRTVEVIFTVDEESHLSYRVVEIEKEENGSDILASDREAHGKNRLVDHSSQQMILLLVYSVFLLIVYIGMKFLFQPPPANDVIVVESTNSI